MDSCDACACNHDCEVADRIFQQLSPDAISKLGSMSDYDTLLSYKSFKNGSITIEISLKPKEPPSGDECCDEPCCEEITSPKTQKKVDDDCCVPQNSPKIDCCKPHSSTENYKPPAIQHFYQEQENDMNDVKIIDVEKIEPQKPKKVNKPHKCPHCDKSFEYKSGLERHQRAVHGKEKPHECQHCNKKFSNKHHLNRHLKQVHGDDRPFECPDCGQRFKDKYNMQVHRRIHTGLKPYICPVVGCGKSFSQKTSLNYHLKTHRDLEFEKDGSYKLKFSN